jgi:hypothetical protein
LEEANGQGAIKTKPNATLIVFDATGFADAVLFICQSYATDWNL